MTRKKYILIIMEWFVYQVITNFLRNHASFILSLKNFCISGLEKIVNCYPCHLASVSLCSNSIMVAVRWGTRRLVKRVMVQAGQGVSWEGFWFKWDEASRGRGSGSGGTRRLVGGVLVQAGRGVSWSGFWFRRDEASSGEGWFRPGLCTLC